MNLKSVILVTVASIALTACGDAVEDEAKRLGFSSASEMERVQSKGWHTNAQYRADEGERARRLGFVDMNELHAAEYAGNLDPVSYRKNKVDEERREAAEEAEAESASEAEANIDQSEIAEASESAATTDQGGTSGSGFFSSLLGKAGLSEARNVVTSACENLSSPSGDISMTQMTQIFGDKKISEWCGCAYTTMSRKFSDQDIADAPSAGVLDETASAIKKSIYSSTAQCMKNSSVPEKGKAVRDSFANILVLLSKQ